MAEARHHSNRTISIEFAPEGNNHHGIATLGRLLVESGKTEVIDADNRSKLQDILVYKISHTLTLVRRSLERLQKTRMSVHQFKRALGEMLLDFGQLSYHLSVETKTAADQLSGQSLDRFTLSLKQRTKDVNDILIALDMFSYRVTTISGPNKSTIGDMHAQIANAANLLRSVGISAVPIDEKNVPVRIRSRTAAVCLDESTDLLREPHDRWWPNGYDDNKLTIKDGVLTVHDSDPEHPRDQLACDHVHVSELEKNVVLAVFQNVTTVHVSLREQLLFLLGHVVGNTDVECLMRAFKSQPIGCKTIYRPDRPGHNTRFRFSVTDPSKISKYVSVIEGMLRCIKAYKTTFGIFDTHTVYYTEVHPEKNETFMVVQSHTTDKYVGTPMMDWSLILRGHDGLVFVDAFETFTTVNPVPSQQDIADGFVGLEMISRFGTEMVPPAPAHYIQHGLNNFKRTVVFDHYDELDHDSTFTGFVMRHFRRIPDGMESSMTSSIGMLCL